MKRQIVFATIMIVALWNASCSLQPSVSSSTFPQIKEPLVTGQPFIETTIQNVRTNNCDGAAPITAAVTRSLDQDASLLQVRVGAGNLVAGGTIPEPLRTDIETKIKSFLDKYLQQNYYQTTISIQMEIPAGKVFEHKISWNNYKVKGTIDVIFSSGIAAIEFEKIIGFEVYDRTSVPLSCNNSQIQPSLLPPTSRFVLVTPTLTQQPLTNLTSTSNANTTEPSEVAAARITTIGIVVAAIFGVIAAAITAYAMIRSAQIQKKFEEDKISRDKFLH